MQKLAEIGWGNNAITLRTATIGIAYSKVVYGAPSMGQLTLNSTE